MRTRTRVRFEPLPRRFQNSGLALQCSVAPRVVSSVLCFCVRVSPCAAVAVCFASSQSREGGNTGGKQTGGGQSAGAGTGHASCLRIVPHTTVASTGRSANGTTTRRAEGRQAEAEGEERRQGQMETASSRKQGESTHSGSAQWNGTTLGTSRSLRTTLVLTQLVRSCASIAAEPCPLRSRLSHDVHTAWQSQHAAHSVREGSGNTQTTQRGHRRDESAVHTQ